ncbi:MAG: UDP-N-acetylmuramate--L-alanine ligase, partial [Candidatus Eiseniibacteriota bacterium]
MYRHRHIHLIGIGGVGMAGIAEVLITQGYTVSGSDLRDTPTTARLRSLGGRVEIGHAAEHVAEADCVVVSSAVPADNPERLAAERRGVPVIPRAEMLGELMRTKYGVAVAGAHGKTTTTSMIAAVLTEGGLDPTVVVGGRVRSTGTGARLGGGNFMVAEADESDGSFVKLVPSVAVVTNIDREHLGHFGSMTALRGAFAAFVERVPFFGAAVLCIDDAPVAELGRRSTRRVVSYGLDVAAGHRATDVTVDGLRSRFQVREGGATLGAVTLAMPGAHNVLNALAAVAVGREFDLPWPVIRDALEGFEGVSRRFEVRGESDGVLLVDDYGHHPTEIAAVLRTARAAWPDRRRVAIFQPHRYSRTRDLADRFATAFGDADRVVVCPIYAAGETPLEGVTARDLATAIAAGSQVETTCVGSVDEAARLLRGEAQPGEVWLTLGAGDVGRIA